MTIKENKYLIFDTEKKIDFIYIIKIIVNLLQRIFYKFLFGLIKPKDCNSHKYKVSLCAIFKDEAVYLREWIEYHKIVGVEHIYLYNNNSSDNYMEVLGRYIKEGYITLIDWPLKQGQMQAYQNWADRFKNESKWVGFIDIDEFVVPNAFDNIYDVLKKFENRPVVIIYWKYFGSSGLENRNFEGLVTEDFTQAWYKYADIGKYFFNTKYEYYQDFKLNKKMHAMWGRYKGLMLPPVNVFDKVCTCGVNVVHTDNMPIQINHYVIKSYNEYTTKKAKRGGGVNPIGIHDMDYFYYHDSFSTGVDTKICKYIGILKESMNKR